MRRNTTYRFTIIWISLILAGFTSCNQQPDVKSKDITVSQLEVLGLENPVAIGRNEPVFSWELPANEPGLFQEAYQVLVATSPEKLTDTAADLWNSGKVESDDHLYAPYEGPLLKSHQMCYWKVRVWTNKGVSAWSDPAFFGIGMKHHNDWWGRWIGFDRTFPGEEVVTFPTLRARYFRKEFSVDKKVASATAYIIGLGLHELHLNGSKVGDAVLAPVPTDYLENVKYNAYDVTDQLEKNNAFGVILGNGRYFTMRPNYKPYKIQDYGFPKMLFQLEIRYMDGSRQVIKSDNSWKGTADGPIRNNNEYDGEFYDARKELSGWSVPGYDDGQWLAAEYVQEPDGTYQAQLNKNMRVMQEVAPVRIDKLGPDTYILDLGQNLSGWLEMRVSGQRGQQVALRFAESLNDDGTLFMTNLRDARVTDTYILKGTGMETWEPRFTYHGFRYVEIKGYPGVPTIDDFTGKMIYDDMATTGQFVTSNSTLNQLHQNAWWGTASNYKGMPVDCPQRNERQPWLGDHAVGAHGENFMFDNAALYKKWLDDIKYSQRGDGSLPDVAPAYWRYYSDNMSWPGTYLVVANMLYEQTGDLSVITDHYSTMKKWLTYMKDRYMTAEYIVTKDSYGDWCVPPPTIEEATGQNADVKRPSRLISTAYYYYFMELMQQFAQLSGNEEDILDYQDLQKKVRNGFNQAFYRQEGYYGDNKMTDNLLPLYFGIVVEENEQKVFDQLVQTIEVTNGGHLSTGVIGTQWLMRTLTRYGRVDLAYQLATNRTYPSWGYMLEHGATTIWELWHGNVANPKMNSQNHVMLLGDLILWFYQHLAGIQAAEPGFASIRLKPEFVADLDFVDATYASVRGTIGSHWMRKDGVLTWEVSVPPNSRATAHLPLGEQVTVNGKSLTDEPHVRVMGEGDRQLVRLLSGTYTFEVRL